MTTSGPGPQNLPQGPPPSFPSFTTAYGGPMGDTEVLQEQVHRAGGTWVPGWPCGQDSPLTKTPITLNLNEE